VSLLIKASLKLNYNSFYSEKKRKSVSFTCLRVKKRKKRGEDKMSADFYHQKNLQIIMIKEDVGFDDFKSY